METATKNFREAQKQSVNENQKANQQEEEVETDVMVEQMVREEVYSVTEEGQAAREDSIQEDFKDPVSDPMEDTLSSESQSSSTAEVPQVLSEEVFKGEPAAEEEIVKPKRTPLRKLIQISRKLGLKHATDAFRDDDPHALKQLTQDIRKLATQELEESQIDMLESFQTELSLMRKRVKKSTSKTDLSVHEVMKLEKVLQRLVNVQNLLQESDLPFVVERDEEPDDDDIKIDDIEELDDFYIDPNDKAALLDDEVFKVIIEEEEVDGYTHWTEPVLQLLKERKAKNLRVN